MWFKIRETQTIYLFTLVENIQRISYVCPSNDFIKLPDCSNYCYRTSNATTCKEYAKKNDRWLLPYRSYKANVDVGFTRNDLRLYFFVIQHCWKIWPNLLFTKTFPITIFVRVYTTLLFIERYFPNALNTLCWRFTIVQTKNSSRFCPCISRRSCVKGKRTFPT